MATTEMVPVPVREERKQWIVGSLLAVLLLATLTLALRTIPLPLYDFVEYWSASKLLLNGGNPYHPATVMAIERSVGWTEPRPLFMLNPPWNFALTAALGVLPLETARALWIALSIVLLLICSDVLWRMYGGDPAKRWIAGLLAVTFVPNGVCLRMGQGGIVILAGLTLFTWSMTRERYFWAGLGLSLMTFKPQLLYLLFIALLLWCARRRKIHPLAAFALCLGLEAAVVLALRPAVFAEYLAFIRSGASTEWASNVGALLRYSFGISHTWLQFLPSAVGLAWFAWYWRSHSAEWNWSQQLPLLVLVSILTCSYGWSFDQPVFMLPIIAMAIKVLSGDSRVPVGLWVVIYAALAFAYTTLNLGRMHELWYLWSTPAWLILWLTTTRHSNAICTLPRDRDLAVKRSLGQA